MVWIWDLVFVFIIACIVFGAIYAMAVRPTYASTSRGAPDKGAADIGCLWLVFLFFLFFLPIWGGGLWLEPIGPAVGGSFVVNFIIIAFVAYLFFVVVWAIMPGTEFSWSSGTAADEDDGSSGWGSIFWIFIIIVVLCIIFGYMWSSPHTMSGSPESTRLTDSSPTLALLEPRWHEIHERIVS